MHRLIVMGFCLFFCSNNAMELRNIGKTELVQLALIYQQNLNKRLHLGIENENFDMCQNAIAAGADVNTLYSGDLYFEDTFDTWLPLHRAERRGLSSIIFLLKNYGAKNNRLECSKVSRTVQLKSRVDTQLALNERFHKILDVLDNKSDNNNNNDVTDILAQGADIDSLSCNPMFYYEVEHGITSLFKATRAGDLDKMRILLQHGANPNKDCKSSCPLFVAIAVYKENKTASILSLLEKFGTNFYWHNIFNQSILHIIAKEPNLIALEYVLKYLKKNMNCYEYVDMLNRNDIKGLTPLMYVCDKDSNSNKKLPILYTLLLLPEISVNCKSEKYNAGRTALMLAAKNTQGIGLLKLLVASKKCNYQLQSNKGKIAYDYAKKANNIEGISILEDPARFIAAAQQDKDLAEFDLSVFKEINNEFNYEYYNYLNSITCAAYQRHGTRYR